jgi:hypothetical protein
MVYVGSGCAIRNPHDHHSWANDLERRRVGLDAQRVMCDQPDPAPRRLLEITIRGLAYRILPHRERALRGERLRDRAGIGAADARTVRRPKRPIHDFVLHRDDLEQACVLGLRESRHCENSEQGEEASNSPLRVDVVHREFP